MLNTFQHALQLEGQNYLAKSEFARILNRCFGETEADYVKKAYLSRLEALCSEEKSRGANSRLSPGQLIDLERKAVMLRMDLQDLAPGDLPAEFARAARDHRFRIVQAAVRNGSMVPRLVLEQYPAGVFLEDIQALPASIKACHMVYSNLRAAMDGSLLDDFGVLIRRQDGKKIGIVERGEIRAGLEAVFAVLGDLSKLLRASHVTIVHTGGKRVFRQTELAAGLYQRVSQTIVIGPRIPGCGGPVESLIHELAGHWLDAVSAPPQAWLDELFCPDNLFYRSAISTSFIDALLDPMGSLYPNLAFEMNPAPEETPERLRPPLSSSELWARLMEQYVIEQLPEPLKAQMVMDKEDYRGGVGYWRGKLWERGLMKQVREQAEARISLADRVHETREIPADRYQQVFPWTKGFGETGKSQPRV
jgi:hypothetical protein